MSTLDTYREIDLPFHIDGQGRIAFSENKAEQIANRLLGLIGTLPTERVMRSRYGTNAGSALFGHTQTLINDISTSIRSAISRWEPTVTVGNIKAEQDLSNTSQVNVLVEFSIKESGVTRKYVATINTGGEVREVLEVV